MTIKAQSIIKIAVVGVATAIGLAAMTIAMKVGGEVEAKKLQHNS